jgi:hypothetical protein
MTGISAVRGMSLENPDGMWKTATWNGEEQPASPMRSRDNVTVTVNPARFGIANLVFFGDEARSDVVRQRG